MDSNWKLKVSISRRWKRLIPREKQSERISERERDGVQIHLRFCFLFDDSPPNSESFFDSVSFVSVSGFDLFDMLFAFVEEELQRCNPLLIDDAEIPISIQLDVLKRQFTDLILMQLEFSLNGLL